jgi:TM2 domain-containing membrane protein YozV
VAQTATVTRRDSISDRRELAAWIMGFIITGTGHMVVGRIARGIAILLGAVLTGFVTFSIELVLGIIGYISYQFFQLYDLHQTIKKLREEQPS